MPRVFVHSYTVPADAIDAYGHVNNLEYLRWMQEVATGHSIAQGWPLQRYLEIGAGWFVRSHAIEYLRPAFEGEAMALLTWVSGFGKRTSARKYLFVRVRDREVVAEAETLWVFVDFKSGSPARIPEELRSAFDVVPATDDVLRALPTDAGSVR